VPGEVSVCQLEPLGPPPTGTPVTGLPAAPTRPAALGTTAFPGLAASDAAGTKGSERLCCSGASSDALIAAGRAPHHRAASACTAGRRARRRVARRTADAGRSRRRRRRRRRMAAAGTAPAAGTAASAPAAPARPPRLPTVTTVQEGCWLSGRQSSLEYTSQAQSCMCISTTATLPTTRAPATGLKGHIQRCALLSSAACAAKGGSHAAPLGAPAPIRARTARQGPRRACCIFLRRSAASVPNTHSPNTMQTTITMMAVTTCARAHARPLKTPFSQTRARRTDMKPGWRSSLGTPVQRQPARRRSARHLLRLPGASKVLGSDAHCIRAAAPRAGRGRRVRVRTRDTECPEP